MYHPKNREDLYDILCSLQHYAELSGMPDLSESLADATMIFALEEKGMSRLHSTKSTEPAQDG